MIAFWDVMPTFKEILNSPSELKTDGISFLPALKEIDKEAHEYLYWDYGHVRNEFMQTVRYGDYKGIRNISKESTTFELYNLQKDISEENNIAEKESSIVEKIIDMMDEAYVYDENYPREIKP